MTELFQLLLVWVGENPFWAGVVIFLVALAESLAIVGILVPGVVILFGAGALIGNGTLDFWSSCLWAVAGAVIGDNISFWLGHHYEDRFGHVKWFRLHPDHLAKGIDFFHKHGGMSIAFGRFFGPIRAVVPLVAGLMRMEPSHFLIANVLSALVWGPAYLLPGMVFGASMEQAGEVSFRLAIIILLLAAIFFGIFKLLRLWIESEPARYGLSSLMLILPLSLACIAVTTESNGFRRDEFLQPTMSQRQPEQLQAQGWKPVSTCEPADLLKFLSPSLAIDQLPLTFSAGNAAAWSRAEDNNHRSILIIEEGRIWQLRERIDDYWLFRLPVGMDR